MERLPLPFAALDSWGNFWGAHCADIVTDEGGALKFLEWLLSCRGRYSPIPVWRPQVQRMAPALTSPRPHHTHTLTGVTGWYRMPGNLSQ